MTKVILITGASSGIGKETAKTLIAEGHCVYAAARRIEKMDDLVKLGAKSIKMDITVDTDIVNAVNTVLEEEGKIDVLVNNAGYAIYGAMEDTTLEDARRQFEVNIFGLARITQLVLPNMRKQNSGIIINMSSMGGKMYIPFGSWYHGTKHALEGWSDCLRTELKDFGIKVVIIEPGGIKTEFDDVMLEPMIERSGKGPYAKLTKKVVKGVKDTYHNNKASHPSVIATCVSKAVNSKKPKTRYRAGYMAKPAVFIRTFLGDRVWDWIITKAR
jgi:short-subunit dehydrogenase